ncbi:uncharacterized protein LOC114175492 [Vigna unguiculata]|uniref:uncharacterized protein LOC114175492 n=1 Tax=Vigna unguiculata TaxID=3917 RepID=UPI001015EBBB|nr:uncharacterized protein LOC114175492 [Vigna unguiculata]
MLISGGNDAVRCKMFVGTLSSTALKWFGKIPHATITSFNDFARLFMDRFAVNRPKQLQIADMFDIKQRQEETLKQFLNRFCDISMGLTNPSEEMLVGAFVKGLRANSFSESLIRTPAATLAEIRGRATVYIETEEAMQRKRLEERRPPPEHKGRDVRRQVMETSSPYKKSNRKFTPYNPRHNPDKRAVKPSCPPFSESKARILQDEEVSKYLRFPLETGRLLGKETSTWCEFHRTHGHDTEDCFPLIGQLASLARRGLVNKYVKGDNMKTKLAESSTKTTAGPHEIPVFGDFNTIAGGFAGGGPTKSARKRYAQTVMSTSVSGFSVPTPNITFSADDTKDIVPHEDDPVVLSVIMMGRNVHRVLIDQGSSADVMFWDTFVGLQIPRDQLLPFDGVLVGFSSEQVEVRGYVDLRTTFSDEHAAKTIVIKYIVVNALSSYNMLLGRPSLNKLGTVVSTTHLKMKFPAEGKIVTMKVDQEVARKCYEKSLRTRRDAYSLAQISRTTNRSDSELDPRPPTDQGPQPIGELKEIEMLLGKKIRIGASLDSTTETAIRRVLQANMSLFAWSVRDMPGINPDILCHRLNINLRVKPRVQRRRRLNDEKGKAATEEIKKLKEAEHIREIQYPDWLTNVVMVKKANGKWRMCVDFTDLNLACPKDSYPLPNIDVLVDRVSGCGLLSFMDAYSGYNQIRMHPEDEDKTAFMGVKANFCYRVMPFGLKNAGATYQRMMDRILQPLLGRNVESYVDDMVVTSAGNEVHALDIQELFDTINKYQLKLNPEKCVFGVRAGKFLGFMLTERGIEANPDKCQAIIDMRSPSCMKEVQQLTGRMAALSRFLARSGDKGHPYFQCLKKNERFQWTSECEDSLTRLKEYLSQPPILSRPEKGRRLQLYITVTEHAISSVLVQDREDKQYPVYFVSRFLHGAEKRYPTLEKAALAVITSARKLRHYFQSFSIQVKTDLPVKQILKRPDMTGRLVKWAIELAEYDITYEPRGPINAQALVDFLAELTLPTPSDPDKVPTSSAPPEWILSVDGASNQKGSGAGVVLEGPGGVLIEQSLRFSFKASNNQPGATHY